ncbi:glutaredoxin 2 [Mycolicibacterium rhodesiae JS60]|nr:glutaredoxin 2 [Mycolicibacterium rhodesiae JS60]
MSRAHVELLTRAGCTLCQRVYHRLTELAAELDFELSATDVDAAAAAGDSALRAEFGDRLPVVLLDGREHSYWDVDVERLRADLASRRAVVDDR